VAPPDRNATSLAKEIPAVTISIALSAMQRDALRLSTSDRILDRDSS